MSSRLRQLIESIVLVRFRFLFTFVYFFLKNTPSIIKTPFYEAHLLSEIQKSITNRLNLFDGKQKLPTKYGNGLSERCVEIPWVLNHVSGKSTILLDAGSSLNFPEILFSDVLKRKTLVISNLNAERNCYWTDRISYVYHDLRKSFFADSVFDEIVCISVLEHIGMDNNRYTRDEVYSQNKSNDYLRTVGLFRRILKKDGKCLITVPFGKHIELKWFQMFDEFMIKKIIQTFKPKKFSVTFYRYDKGTWNLSTMTECRMSQYRNDYPQGNYCVAAEAVACIELQK